MQVPRTHLKPSLQDLYNYLDSIGGYLSASVAQGSAVALTTATTANVTSITLTEGEWDVSGVTAFLPAGTTSITVLSGGASDVSATIGSLGAGFALSQAAVVPGAVAQILPNPVYRVTVPAGQTKTIYLVARATFTVAALSAFGTIQARRVA